MSLILDMPPGRTREREYAAQVVLQEFLGLEVRFRTWSEHHWRLSLPESDSGAHVLNMPDVFFSLAKSHWLASQSLPRSCDQSGHQSVVDNLPPLFAGPEETQLDHVLNYDVLGAAFFMLTRYEELVSLRRDRFERFEWRSSCLHGMVDVCDPFIDRAVEALRQRIEAAWPVIKCHSPVFEFKVTHDVDALRNRGRPLMQLLAACGADVVRRRDPLLAARRAWSARPASASRLDASDPFNTFDFVMGESEKRGIRSSFYFVPGPRRHPYDPDYDVMQPDVLDLLRRIGQRGHRIGLHASFDAAKTPGAIEREFVQLRRAAESVGVRQDEWGGRHHYLRWLPVESWSQWNDAGLTYDSSVGYAEVPGFRCGTSRSFQVWDLIGERKLALREYPLTLMEATLFNYQRLAEDAALASCRKLARACRQYGGTLVLLWHNHNFLTPSARELYCAMLSAVCEAP